MKKHLMTLLAASLLAGLASQPAWADTNTAVTAGTNRGFTETPLAPGTAPAVPVLSPTRENNGEWRDIPGAHTLVELAPFGMILGIVALSAYFKYHRHK